MLAMDFLAAGTSQAVQTTRVGLDMVLNIRPLPFHKRFVGFGQSLPQQFIHNITADALNSGDNALRRRLRTLAALTETDTTETCGGTQSQYVFQLFAHAGKPLLPYGGSACAWQQTAICNTAGTQRSPAH